MDKYKYKYLVVTNRQYYPDVEVFKNLKDARKRFIELSRFQDDEEIYLVKVLDKSIRKW